MRFWSSGGSLFEKVAGSVIQRDPLELRRLSEEWSREAVMREHTDFPRAKLYADAAFQAQVALSLWEQQKKAAGHNDPFADEGKTKGGSHPPPRAGHHTADLVG